MADINEGDGDSSPIHLTVYDGKLFFSADDGTDRELWSYDATSGEAMEMAYINEGDGSSKPNYLTAYTYALP